MKYFVIVEGTRASAQPNSTFFLVFFYGYIKIMAAFNLNNSAIRENNKCLFKRLANNIPIILK